MALSAAGLWPDGNEWRRLERGASTARFVSLGGRGSTAPPDRLLQSCRIEIFGFRLGENSQNISQVARGAPDFLCASALQAPAKSFSEFQENMFVVRIAELRLGPLLDGTFRFENTVFHLLVPDWQRLVLFAEHSLEEGFNQYVH
jgi:hypothetical protein